MEVQIKILFLTIALDSMPFLPLIWAELRKLPKQIQWEWHIMEGVAYPEHCTKWVKEIEARLSHDGTTEYIQSLVAFDERVRHRTEEEWDGKIEMVNFPLRLVSWEIKERMRPNEEFLLWQIDGDEIWDTYQIRNCWLMFEENPQKNAAYFWCRYFVGHDKVITTRNCFGNNSSYEWLRVWRIKPGMLFKTHEPPVIDGLKLNPFTHAETEARGLVFSHYAYATRAQVAFKEQFYAGPNNPNARHYKGLTERWEKFQTQTQWPRPLKEVMPWVENHCLVNKI